MTISSINVKPIKAGSESHNRRSHKMEHVHHELTRKNELYIQEAVYPRLIKIRKLCKEKSGRHMYSNATPIREAVVNLEARHNLQDLQKLSEALRKKFGVHCFQMYIHRDEGYTDRKTGEFKPNYHAHLIIDWQDKIKGTTKKINKLGMVEMQSLVADTLGMERGKEGSKAVRLEAQAYKATKRLQELEEDISDLEAKKKVLENELKAQEEEETLREHRLWEEERRSRENKLLQLYGQTRDKLKNAKEKLQNAKQNLNDYRHFLQGTDQQWRKQLEELMKSLQNRTSILKKKDQLIKQSKIEQNTLEQEVQNLEQQLKDLEAVQSTKSVRYTVRKPKSIDDDMSL